MTGLTVEMSNIILLAEYVTYWLLAQVFHTNPAKIYRIVNSFARHNIVKSTVKTVDVPTDVAVDEHHEKRKGEKCYIATIVAGGCVLDSEYCWAVTSESLTEGYGVFKRGFLNVDKVFTEMWLRRSHVVGRGRCCIIIVIGVRERES
jgi:hypothetical protein